MDTGGYRRLKGREVGGGGVQDICIPMADSCRCMAKTTTVL